ncbi:hypothetical protein GCK32_001282 [Trichostrongylus colubriformis]|uniref:Uncharacterized protein n=1 Tax=Trichostrongylus colubriformis TaxID=6319 RepID=A0AAN8ERU6_TRICO
MARINKRMLQKMAQTAHNVRSEERRERLEMLRNEKAAEEKPKEDPDTGDAVPRKGKPSKEKPKEVPNASEALLHMDKTSKKKHKYVLMRDRQTQTIPQTEDPNTRDAGTRQNKSSKKHKKDRSMKGKDKPRKKKPIEAQNAGDVQKTMKDAQTQTEFLRLIVSEITHREFLYTLAANNYAREIEDAVKYRHLSDAEMALLWMKATKCNEELTEMIANRELKERKKLKKILFGIDL